MYCITFKVQNSELDALADITDLAELVISLLNEHGNSDIRVSTTDFGDHSTVDLVPDGELTLITRASYLIGLVSGYLWSLHIHKYEVSVL